MNDLRKFFGKGQKTGVESKVKGKASTQLVEGPEIVVLIVGETGSGKSSFINDVTGAQSVRVGYSLESETKEINSVKWICDGRRVMLVDTVGFDDTYLSDTDVFARIATFLTLLYERKVYVSGILYLHPINRARMSGSARKTLRIFQELCGSESLKNVIFVTTFWDRLQTKQEGYMREQELTGSFWSSFLAHGSQVERHSLGMKKEARALIQRIIRNQTLPLQVQKEIVDQRKALLATKAGAAIAEDTQRTVNSIKSSLETIKSEKEDAQKSGDNEFIKLIEEEEAQLRAKLHRALGEIEKTDVGFREEQETARQAIGNGPNSGDYFWYYFGDDERKQWLEVMKEAGGTAASSSQRPDSK